MTKVEAIKAEIEKLSFQERCELNALLHPLPDDEWDKQMRVDAEAGKLDWMIEEAERCEREKTAREFPRPRE
ncbi:MAG: hypothetical protein HZA90_10740 [Verrucomicrobia bacterium]|nr:hypothetical protein [Verrucomicrobiota bacterium]